MLRAETLKKLQYKAIKSLLEAGTISQITAVSQYKASIHILVTQESLTAPALCQVEKALGHHRALRYRGLSRLMKAEGQCLLRQKPTTQSPQAGKEGAAVTKLACCLT